MRRRKLLAAHRAGITMVLIPKRNEPDLEDVPENAREQLTVHAVSDVREVLGLALEPENSAPAHHRAAAAFSVPGLQPGS